MPARIAVFKDGSFLASGLENPTAEMKAPRIPYTALFDSSGAFLKKIVLPDDSRLTAAFERGGNEASTKGSPAGTMVSVAWGSAASGADGNIYLMRRTSPAIIYVISPGGEVVRKLTVDPPQPGMMPDGLQDAKEGMVVFFAAEGPASALLADRETGDTLGVYQIPVELGYAFACYADGAFTFMGQEAGKRVLVTARP